MANDVVSPSSLCCCSDRKALHVHCFCGVCNGKAMNYRKQISHLRLRVQKELKSSPNVNLPKVLAVTELRVISALQQACKVL